MHAFEIHRKWRRRAPGIVDDLKGALEECDEIMRVVKDIPFADIADREMLLRRHWPMFRRRLERKLEAPYGEVDGVAGRWP